MTSYRYRAFLADGSSDNGQIEASDPAQAVMRLRRAGLTPIHLVPAVQNAAGDKQQRVPAKARAAGTLVISELAVLLRAGLPLDRALALAIENIETPIIAAVFSSLLEDVREGMPLSRAMGRRPGLFAPAAIAMSEAGEANGQLSDALSRVAAMLEQAAELRRLVVSSLIYPIALLVIAVSVVLLMLLFVVPRFETMFDAGVDKLPAASMLVIGASRALRDHGLLIVGGIGALLLALRQAMARPAARAALDRNMLRAPLIGPLIRRMDTARFARTLGALLEGEVPLPAAVRLAQRTFSNRYMADAMARVAEGIKEGSGLSGPLSSERIFPPLAMGFIRTGEESSQMGPMLTRLADVLDRDVKVRLQRFIAIATPAIIVVLGTVVAGIIASVMSAILGFNDLATVQ